MDQFKMSVHVAIARYFELLVHMGLFNANKKSLKQTELHGRMIVKRLCKYMT